MKAFLGKSISGKIASGPVFKHGGFKESIYDGYDFDASAELNKLSSGIDKSLSKLSDLYEDALKRTDESKASIFEAYKLILMDEVFLRLVRADIVDTKRSAYDAVFDAAKQFSTLLATENIEYFREREEDIRYVSQLLVSYIGNTDNNSILLEEPSVLVAEEISPMDIISIDQSKLLALVVRTASVSSHAMILAKSLDIPVIICSDMNIDEIGINDFAIADGINGKFIINPDSETMAFYDEEINSEAISDDCVCEETVSYEGKVISVCANVNSSDDCDDCKKYKADGIGLYRSEYLLLKYGRFLSEEEQYSEYSKVLNSMEGKEVVVRTFDFCEDKAAPFLHNEFSEDFAKGVRGIELCLGHREFFKTQIKALLRAGVFGNLYVMLPMISSLNELDETEAIINEAAGELEEENKEYKRFKIAVMIETPEAVNISAELAKKAGYFSIGSNDLLYYAMGKNRFESKSFDEKYPEKVFSYIATAVRNAHEAGIRVGLCGDLAGDIGMTLRMLELGIDELSVPASVIPVIKKTVKKLSK